jgi:hypothetical protein
MRQFYLIDPAASCVTPCDVEAGMRTGRFDAVEMRAPGAPYLCRRADSFVGWLVYATPKRAAEIRTALAARRPRC